MSLRRFATVFAVLLALVVLAVAAIGLAGIDVDAQRWREPIAAALSRALGREVRLDGPARLSLSFHPTLVVGDVRIANPPGFDAPEFGRIAELTLATDLLPLLHNQLNLRELRGREVWVRLARSSEGRGNWIFEPQARDAAQERLRPFRVDWGRVAVEQGTVEFAGAAATRRFELEALTLDGLTGPSVRLALRGKLDQGGTYTAEATSAALQELAAERPWPFEVRVVLPAAAVNVSGTRRIASEGPVLRLAFDARAADVREVGRLLGVKLPIAGAAQIAGELDLSPSFAALKSIKGRIGTAAVEGDLAFDLTRARPLLSGRLAIADLDLRSFTFPAGGADAKEPGTLSEAYRTFESAALDLKWMAQLDSELQLGIGRLTGIPGEVRDISASLRLESGRLAAPFSVTIAGARFEGDLAADGTTTPPRLRASLVARDAPLGALAELVCDVPFVEGSVRRFEVVLDAAGNRWSELARDLEGRIRVEGAQLTYGNYAGARPVAMRLDAAELAQPRGRTIAGQLRGSLRGKAFAGAFRAGTVEGILRERGTPFGFDGISGAVRASLSGTLAEPGERSGPAITFEVTAPQARELAPWLGFSSQSAARVALKGTAQLRQRDASLSGASLRIGRTMLTGDAAWQTLDGKALVKVDLYAELLAPVELRSLAPAAGRATLLEIPILPESLDFADMDLDLRIKRIDGLPLEIAGIALQGRMRGGEIAPSPFTLSVEGNALSGTLALDARGEAPAAALTVEGRDVDVGPLLRRLRVARDVDSRIGTLRLSADIRERRLGDALEQSSFVVRFESGTIAFLDTNTRAALRIAVKAGEVRADAGAPVTASVSGMIGTTPVTLEVRGGRLRELVEPGERLPFSLTAQTPAAKLAISGSAAPQRNPDVALSLALSGERLDGLDTLLEASLPPWGPYAITGSLRFSRRGYEVEAMRLALGVDSVLTGRGSLDTALAPPRFDVSLAAERIQLEDFPLGDWSPFEPRAGPAGPATVETTRQRVAAGARQVHAMLSRELLGHLEGTFDAAAMRVVSGKEELGRGRLRVVVEKGRATIAPIEVEAAAGTARGALAYEPREHDVLVDARIHIHRYDYGVLARRFRPDAELSGELSLDLRIAATAPRLSAALDYGSGRLDFAIWPQRLSAGGLDLWSANLLLRLLPIVNVTASPVNCTVGVFDLERGQLRSLRLVIDTGNTRVDGSGTADFRTDEVDLRFVPRPKVPQFFSLATPVEVRGTFDDYRIRVRPTDFLGTLVKWVTSVVTVPVERLIGARIPEDGHDICMDPWRLREHVESRPHPG